jgi:hypothetical protein
LCDTCAFAQKPADFARLGRQRRYRDAMRRVRKRSKAPIFE